MRNPKVSIANIQLYNNNYMNDMNMDGVFFKWLVHIVIVTMLQSLLQLHILLKFSIVPSESMDEALCSRMLFFQFLQEKRLENKSTVDFLFDLP